MTDYFLIGLGLAVVVWRVSRIGAYYVMDRGPGVAPIDRYAVWRGTFFGYDDLIGWYGSIDRAKAAIEHCTKNPPGRVKL